MIHVKKEHRLTVADYVKASIDLDCLVSVRCQQLHWASPRRENLDLEETLIRLFVCFGRSCCEHED